MLAELSNSFDYIFSPFFNFECLKTEEHGLEVGGKSSRRNYDYFFLIIRVVNKVACIHLDRTDFIYQKVIVNGLGRNKHKSKRQCPLFRPDILGRLVDTFLQIVANS